MRRVARGVAVVARAAPSTAHGRPLAVRPPLQRPFGRGCGQRRLCAGSVPPPPPPPPPPPQAVAAAAHAVATAAGEPATAGKAEPEAAAAAAAAAAEPESAAAGNAEAAVEAAADAEPEPEQLPGWEVLGGGELKPAVVRGRLPAGASDILASLAEPTEGALAGVRQPAADALQSCVTQWLTKAVPSAVTIPDIPIDTSTAAHLLVPQSLDSKLTAPLPSGDGKGGAALLHIGADKEIRFVSRTVMQNVKVQVGNGDVLLLPAAVLHGWDVVYPALQPDGEAAAIGVSVILPDGWAPAEPTKETPPAVHPSRRHEPPRRMSGGGRPARQQQVKRDPAHDSDPSQVAAVRQYLQRRSGEQQVVDMIPQLNRNQLKELVEGAVGKPVNDELVRFAVASLCAMRPLDFDEVGEKVFWSEPFTVAEVLRRSAPRFDGFGDAIVEAASESTLDPIVAAHAAWTLWDGKSANKHSTALIRHAQRGNALDMSSQVFIAAYNRQLPKLPNGVEHLSPRDLFVLVRRLRSAANRRELASLTRHAARWLAAHPPTKDIVQHPWGFDGEMVQNFSLRSLTLFLDALEKLKFAAPWCMKAALPWIPLAEPEGNFGRCRATLSAVFHNTSSENTQALVQFWKLMENFYKGLNERQHETDAMMLLDAALRSGPAGVEAAEHLSKVLGDENVAKVQAAIQARPSLRSWGGGVQREWDARGDNHGRGRGRGAAASQQLVDF